jgi:hypothetical protein
MSLRLMFAFSATLVLLAACAVAEQPPSCKPVERYGVKGCEILPDHTCPPGYRKKVVNPPDPRMTTPSYLMCVPDEPPKKDRKPAPATTSPSEDKKS